MLRKVSALVQLNCRWIAQRISEPILRHILKPILLLFLCSISSLGIFAQSKATVGIDEIYLAKDDGKGKAGEAATSFVTTDVPIYCVVQLDSTIPVTVKMNLVAANVPGVKAETKVVSTSYTTKDGENRVNFSGKPAGKWVAGKYRADIFVDGKFVKDLAFEIRTSGTTISEATFFQPTSDPKPKPAARTKRN